jgi:predicted lipoprotein with Yx(FWY)xxD motif
MILLVLIAALLVAGCTQNPASQQPAHQAAQPTDTIGVSTSQLGNILVDGQGNTLYYFAADTPASGTSTCTGSCAGIWPIFYSDTITVSPPLMASDFSSIIRADGRSQTTYRGWPLYYFQGDTKAGDTSGENVNKDWFVVKPDETVMIAKSSSLGLFLTDRMGNTLYYFAKDTPGTSACTGACLAKWPAFNAGSVSAPSVLDPADFGSLTRTDGTNQTTFMGRPLYYFTNDTKPGDTNGQGFNNLWSVANITGTLPAAPSPASTTVIPTASMTSNGESY